MKQKHEEQREDVARVVKIVDQLAKKYDPRYFDSTSKLMNDAVETKKDQCVEGVNNEFLGVWLHTIEPSSEELAMYDEHLASQLRPTTIYSPSFPPTRVQWSSLNTNYLRNMPKPEAFPVESCSVDPSLYTVIISKTPRDNVNIGCGRPVITTTDSAFHKPNPFGTLYGFMTDVGVLPVPEMRFMGTPVIHRPGLGYSGKRGLIRGGCGLSF